MTLIDTLVIVVTSSVVGGAGIFLGVSLVVDNTIGFDEAVVTALVGAVAWGTVSFYRPHLPVLGGLSTLVIWVALIDLRYPRGWPSAAGIGFAAWLASSVLLYLLGTLGLVSFSAVGIPTI